MRSYTTVAHPWGWLTLAGLAALWPERIHAYEPHCTHATLTRRSAELYARHYGQAFSAAQIEQLAQGSIHEDLGAIPFLRATNHFYDIHQGRGWTSPLLAFVTPCLNEAQAKDYFRTSRDWALTPAHQQVSWTGNFPLGVSIRCHYDGDYSWPTILSMLDVSAPFEKVAYAEGHILHLLQDLTVPAHTRNDTHLPLPGEKYELFAKDLCNATQIPTAEELYTEGVRPIVLAQLGDYFDTLATYSYSHYFSDDTKFSKDYDAPLEKRRETIDIDGKKRTYIYAEDPLSVQYGAPVEYRLAGVNTRLEKYIPKEVAQYKEIVYYLDDTCLGEYWRRLSRKAIAYGAGALRKLALETATRGKCSECMPNATRCNENRIEMCQADGCGWTSGQICSCGCNGGRCIAPACTPGAKQCAGATVEACRTDGCGWLPMENCANGCVGGLCRPPPPPSETCNGLDDDGNGIIDDPLSCWQKVYRFVNNTTKSRCWGLSATPPPRCSGYVLERTSAVFVVRTNKVADTHEKRQCSKGTDHVLTLAGGGEHMALESSGWDCSLSLGYYYDNGKAPPTGKTPLLGTCPLYRFRYNFGGGQAHLFTIGSDILTGMTCEGHVADAFSDSTACFAGPPAGC